MQILLKLPLRKVGLQYLESAKSFKKDSWDTAAGKENQGGSSVHF